MCYERLTDESFIAQEEIFGDALHGGRDDSLLSAKLIRIAPETSSF
jgi:hypothetical protein